MRLTSFLFVLFFSMSLVAETYMDMAVGIGYRANDGDSATQGFTVDGEAGLILGGTAYIPMVGQWQLRTGFLLNERYYTVSSGATDVEIELMYVDVPLTAMYKFSDFGGAFAGIALGFNASDDCGSSECQEVEDLVTPVQFGGFFKIGPQIALEVFYEMNSGEIVQGIEDTTAVGACILFTLE